MVSTASVRAAGQLGPVLKSLRQARGWSQTELGRQVGLSQERISSIERHPERVTLGQLLTLLMADAGKVLTRRELLDGAWGEGYPDHNKTLDVHVLRVRKKILKAGSSAGECIRTIRSVGYIFDLPTW